MLEINARVRPNRSATWPKMSPPAAPPSSVTEPSAPAWRLGEPQVGDHRGEREREEHHVERVERPAQRRGDERAPRGGARDAPPAECAGVVWLLRYYELAGLRHVGTP